jgi:hypothetical protein
MLASPQNRVFLGFVVRISLNNDWVIAQTYLRAVVIEKLEAGSGKTTLVILTTVLPKVLRATICWLLSISRGLHSKAIICWRISLQCTWWALPAGTKQLSDNQSWIPNKKCTKWNSPMFAKTFVMKLVILTFLPRSALGNVSVVNCAMRWYSQCGWRLFCVVSIKEIIPFRCNHDWNQFCVDDPHNIIPL